MQYEDAKILIKGGSVMAISGASAVYLINLPSTVAVTSTAVASTCKILGAFSAVFGAQAVIAGIASYIILAIKEYEYLSAINEYKALNR